MKFKLQLFILFITYCYCCENMCGGHGICGQNDKCECFIGWGASDCSQRVCPYGEAFIDIPLGDLDHDGKITEGSVKTEWRPNSGISENLKNYVTTTRAHRYAECSNAGLCDRTTGTCTCFPGFEGSSCQRRSCPSAVDGRTCSGHGSCLSGSAILAETETNTYFSWDTMKYRTCVCDKGWEGVDCNLRQCIMGIDPVSAQSMEFKYKFELKEYDGFDYYFEYTYDGILYESIDIKGRKLSGYCPAGSKIDSGFASEYAEEIRRAIRLITPLSQSTVAVSCSSTTAGVLSIEVDAKYVDADKYCSSELSIKPDVEEGKTTSIDVTADKDTTKCTDPDKKPTQSLCSGRGLCNTDSGLCECFPGYYGAACENQLSIAI